MTVVFGGWPNFSLIEVPAGAGAFTIPTPPTPVVAARPLYSPNFTAGWTGKDPYRPVCDVEIDGIRCFANGYDEAWWEDVDDPTVAHSLGADTPGAAGGEFASNGFALALDAGGTYLANNETAFYRLVYRNEDTGKESPPQEHSLLNNAGAASGVTISWLPVGPPALAAQWTHARIYRKLSGASGYVFIADVAVATATYDDDATHAAVEDNTPQILRLRTTRLDGIKGMVAFQGRLFVWTGEDSKLHFGPILNPAFPDMRFDDFHSYRDIGAEDGYGSIVAAFEHAGSLYVLKERAVYVVEGDIPDTDSVRIMVGARGCISRRCLIPVLDVVGFLDASQGLLLWTPGGEPLVAGAAPGSNFSPLAPDWKRLNRAAADLMCGIYHEATGDIELHLALDHSPIPNYRAVYSTSLHVWAALEPMVWLTAVGYLDDAQRIRHLCAGCDLGFLHELYAGNADGCYLGDTTATLTAATGLGWDASAASFSTALRGAEGTPVVRMNASGDVIDQNRVVDVLTNTVTPLYFPATAAAAGHSIALGAIAGLVEFPRFTFGITNQKLVERCYLGFEVEDGGTLRVDTQADDDGWVQKATALDLTEDAPFEVATDDHCASTWRLRAYQPYAGMGFALTMLEVDVAEKGIRGQR